MENSKSIEEVKIFNEKQQRIAEFANTAKGILNLLDLANSNTPSYTIYDKNKLRTAMENPLSATNQKTLRNLSQFLYHLSFQLRRLINYYASQIDLSLYTVVPFLSMVDDVNQDDILKNYDAVCTQMDKMNLDTILKDAILTAWREDCVYLYFYYEQGEGNIFNFVPMIMSGDYCKICAKNYDGTYSYAFDFSYFNGTNKIYLDYWDREFTKKYNAYSSDSSLRWQELDPARSVCFKVNSDQWDRVIPPLAAIFESVIDSIDLRGLLSIKDELSVYKLLVAKIDSIKNSNEPDNFEIDLDTATAFYNKIAEVLPDFVGCILSPMKIDKVDLGGDATQDTDRIEQSVSNIYSNAGGIILDNKMVSNSSGVNAALMADALLAKKSLLPQIEAWVNRMLEIFIPNNGMVVRYMKDVTPYNRMEILKETKEAATLGIPGAKLKYATLVGFSPKDAYGMQILENNILMLTENWKPLQSTYTQSSNGEAGAPEKDEGELTDEGAATREKEKNAK